jgi:DNA polymerase-3 subunit gamma/tau
MPYVVLSRKWRPLSFDDVVAQEHITATLKNAISSDRIAHAYLFSGPRGVGKTTTARILAKALNCVEGPTPNPCNKCTACKEITHGVSLDVLEIDGASNRGIDEVRDLRENVRYAPSQSRYKIYYIDEVHMLTTPAFNALLKTLEEPPARVVFIFATTQPHNIPLTVLSRCQRFDFKRIPSAEIIKRLQFMVSQEGMEIDKDSLLLIAKKADGAMRDAESLLDQVIAFGGNQISSQTVESLLGLVERQFFFDLIDVVAQKDSRRGLELVEKVIEDGRDVGEIIRGLLEHLRDLLFAKIPGGMKNIEASEGDKLSCETQAKGFSEEDLLRMIKIISDLEASISRAPHPRLKLEIAIVRLIKLDSTVLLNELLERFSRLEGRFKGETFQINEEKSHLPLFEDKPEQLEHQKKTAEELPEKAEEVAAKPADLEVSLENIRQYWPQIVDTVKQRKVSLGSLLSHAVPVELSGNILQLSFKKEESFSAKKVEKNARLVEKTIGEMFTAPLKVKCVVVNSEESPSSVKASLEELYQAEPLLRSVVEIFDGELTGGSPDN